ncbi:DUF4214 domain-containing protein [bacterium]|nr:DUF4214 domain-containing protein [bacterium]
MSGLKKLIMFVAVGLSTILLFQNCGGGLESMGGDALSVSNFSSSLRLAGVDQLSQLPLKKSDCSELNGKSGVRSDQSGTIQSCINRSVGSTLELPPGIYFVNGPIYINSNSAIITKGKSIDSDSCSANDSSCFQIRALPTAAVSGRSGLMRIEGSQIVISHIIVDGNRSERLNSAAARECQAGENFKGFTSTALVDGFLFKNNVLKNALCGTALELHSGTVNAHFLKNKILDGGDNLVHMHWADGLTIHDAVNSTFSENTFVDNTDVQLVFGGCQGCVIASNTFSHTTSPNKSAFAELMIHAWPGGSGDFTNSTAFNNSIDCGLGKRCGFGIIVGGDNWYPGTKAFGINIQNNSIKNAMIGLSVDDATGGVHIVGNNFDEGTDGEFQCHQNKSIKKRTSVYNISPGSMKYLTPESRAEYDQLLTQRGADAVTSRDLDGCIPQTGLFNAKPFPMDRVITGFGVSNPNTPTQPPIPPVPPTSGGSSGSTGGGAPVANTSHFAIVISLYQTVLGRSHSDTVADQEGLSYWASRLASGMSVSELTNQLKGSDEYFIHNAYATYLRRDPAMAEVEYWKGELLAGRMSRNGLVSTFVSACANKSNGECR